MTKRCKEWLTANRPSTPCLIIDLKEIENNVNRFKNTFPNILPFYSVKANPAIPIIKSLNKLGCFFDSASVNEINICIKCGVDATNISYGNTIKKEKDISIAYKLGVRVFVFDCIEELHKIARSAPKSKVFCRILVSNKGARWPLNKKFGCSIGSAKKLITEAKDLGLCPIGISFHVGSQQTLVSSWSEALKTSAPLYDTFDKNSPFMDSINLGGGIPIRYMDSVIDIEEISNNLSRDLDNYFGSNKPKNLIMEPGRFFVGNSGIIETEIVLISEKDSENKSKWLYLDIGRFGGLAETEGEAIRYPIETLSPNYNDEVEPVIISGPTCDSHDMLYQKYKYYLPKNLKIGDRLRIGSAGAYTSVYASNFNGIDLLKEYFI